MAEVIDPAQTERLQRLRNLLGEARFQHIQREVWKHFSLTVPPVDREGHLAPPALVDIFDELVHALAEATKQLARDKEIASRLSPTSGPVWELRKWGVTWSATLNLRSDHRGWDVVITRNGQRLQIRRFLHREKAEAWADEECVEIALGWKG
jgi:hypothetical protein